MAPTSGRLNRWWLGPGRLRVNPASQLQRASALQLAGHNATTGPLPN
jgi:hypothetical protein